MMKRELQKVKQELKLIKADKSSKKKGKRKCGFGRRCWFKTRCWFQHSNEDLEFWSSKEKSNNKNGTYPRNFNAGKPRNFNAGNPRNFNAGNPRNFNAGNPRNFNK